MHTVLQLPDHTDALTQIHPAYQDADIRLQFIEHLEGFRFVYLHPHTPVD